MKTRWTDNEVKALNKEFEMYIKSGVPPQLSKCSSKNIDKTTKQIRDKIKYTINKQQM